MGRNKKLAKNVVFILIGNPLGRVGGKSLHCFLFYTAWLSPEGTWLDRFADCLCQFAFKCCCRVMLSNAMYIFPIKASREKLKAYYSEWLFLSDNMLICCVRLYLAWSRKFHYTIRFKSIFGTYIRHIDLLVCFKNTRKIFAVE